MGNASIARRRTPPRPRCSSGSVSRSGHPSDVVGYAAARPAADRRDCPRARPRHARADDGRADLGAHRRRRSRSSSSLIRDLAAHGVAHRLHLAPARGAARSCGRRHGAARRRGRRPRAADRRRRRVDRRADDRRDAAAASAARGRPRRGAPMLSVQRPAAAVPAPGANRPSRRVASTCAPGRFSGVYGLMGAGRTELMESVLGVHADARGQRSSRRRTRSRRWTSRERVARGMAMVPEDRQASGLVADDERAAEHDAVAASARSRAAATSRRRAKRPRRRNGWRRPADQDAGARRADRCAQRRQPAEGRDRARA